MVETFTKSWYNGDYKKRRTEVLFGREEARLQETMDYIQFLQDFYEYHDKEMMNIVVERQALINARNVISDKIFNRMGFRCNSELAKYTKEIDNNAIRKNQLHQLTQHAMNVVWGSPREGEYLTIQNVIYNKMVIDDAVIAKVAVNRKTFTMTCPKDTCQGFLSQRYKCGICSIYVCPDCHEVKSSHDDDKHVCDANVVKSIAMIKKDSKQCPSCHSLIHRYEGCPQMWCTQCKVAFDWTTGRIENGPVHNPHYTDWVRENGGSLRTIAIRACGQVMDQLQMIGILSNYFPKHDRVFDCVNLIRTINHIEQIEMGNLRNKMANFHQSKLEEIRRMHTTSRIIPKHMMSFFTLPENDPNRHLRLFYLMGLIDKDTAMKMLQVEETTRFTLVAWYNLYEMFVNTCKDLLIQMENTIVENHGKEGKRDTTIKMIRSTHEQLASVVKYFNNQRMKGKTAIRGGRIHSITYNFERC